MFEGDEKKEGRTSEGKFDVGNTLWRSCTTQGAKRIFENPDDLMEACIKYFEWADDTPLYEYKVFGTGFTAKLPHARAMTIRGLCVHAGIGRRTWDEYRDRPDFKETCEIVEDIMFEQKFAGAAAGLFNSTIIARDLGLADKKEIDGDLTIEIVDSYEADNED